MPRPCWGGLFLAVSGPIFSQCLRPAEALRSSVQAAAWAWARNSCEQNLWMTMDTCLRELDDNTSYVITGDINAMWTRDSTAQMWPYLLMLEKHASDGQEKTQDEQSALQHLERVLAGTLRRQAKFLETDPYANAYTDTWDSAKDTRLCRGGFVFTGNYEVDSGVYFMKFLTRMLEHDLRQRPAKQARPQGEISMLQDRHQQTAEAGDPRSSTYSLVQDPTLRSAVEMLVAVYRQERDHAKGKSHHRYPLSAPWELPGENGGGNAANWTGMVWGAFRPSDDPQTYAYNIPNNLFLASVLGPLSKLAEEHWEKSEKLVLAMKDLRQTILEGVEKHGTTSASKAGLAGAKEDEKVYCYEVDGLGNCLLMDDANVPSLLSLPYLDPTGTVFDQTTYDRTREFVLSPANPWYFEGDEGRGVGSPHRGEGCTNAEGMIWPLSMVMQVMTATSQHERDEVMTNLFQIQTRSSAHNGLSESFHKDDASQITRPWFAWPNALLAEHLMQESASGCEPSLAELKNHLPSKPQEAKRTGPLKSLQTEFYLAPAAQLRRERVVLPADEYLAV